MSKEVEARAASGTSATPGATIASSAARTTNSSLKSKPQPAPGAARGQRQHDHSAVVLHGDVKVLCGTVWLACVAVVSWVELEIEIVWVAPTEHGACAIAIARLASCRFIPLRWVKRRRVLLFLCTITGKTCLNGFSP
jgi:hypothetical protein